MNVKVQALDLTRRVHCSALLQQTAIISLNNALINFRLERLLLCIWTFENLLNVWQATTRALRTAVTEGYLWSENAGRTAAQRSDVN
jgi:hypothetical protein